MSGRNQLSVSDLWYAKNDWPEVRARLPGWARFMARCGQRLASTEGRPLTIGVSVPGRGYSAALAAAGATLARDTLNPMAPDDLGRHLATLRETPAGTPIKYQTKDQILDGRWLGIVDVEGEEMLSFETRNMTRKLRLNAALHILLTGEATSSGQLWAKKIKVSPLLKAMIGESAAVTFMTTARADCVMVGTQTQLEQDLTSELLFAGGKAGTDDGGHLQDVVRAHDLAGARRFFRSVVVPSATGPSSELRAARPHLVIYDGGRPYLRWRHVWPGAQQLVVLDRSLASAEEAATELSMAYAERAADSVLLNKSKVPAGLEAICFERRA